MIILPDGTPLNLQAGNITTFETLNLNSNLGIQLKSDCEAFLNSPACVSTSVETVHVTQGEFAEIYLTGNVTVFGSSDATTCAIIVVIDHQSGRAVVCHHDESTITKLDNITQGILSGMQSPELYLLGGALCGVKPHDGAESRQNEISHKTVTSLLQAFHSLSNPVKLKLFCALEWNTDPVTRSPRCQSLAMSLSNQQQANGTVAAAAVITATAFAVPPGGWKDRGPLIIPRLAQIWLEYSRSKRLRPIYDAENGQWSIRLLEGSALQGEEKSTKIEPASPLENENKTNSTCLDSRLLDLSDTELLQCCSTSPECELPHIAGETRECLKWAMAQVPPLHRVEHRFQFNRITKQWGIVYIE